MDRDDIDPMTRAAFAIVVACQGDQTHRCDWVRAAEIAGVSPTELRQSMYALRERREQ